MLNPERTPYHGRPNLLRLRYEISSKCRHLTWSE